MNAKAEAELREIRACRICEDVLPLGPRPVVQLHPEARILIAGQAPGSAVHRTGVPFDDPSGDRLRDWLGVTRDEFWDERRFAILPMGFCYPGRGRGGDLPPRPECSATWRARALVLLPRIELTLAIGRYAQAHHLPVRPRASVTERVRAWRSTAPGIFPLPHPSPRNARWLARNPWFSRELVPELRGRVRQVLDRPGGTRRRTARPRTSP